MIKNNATYLFNGDDKNWPASSESFWTTLFGLFVLHLSNIGEPTTGLNIWQGANGTDGKWYERRKPSTTLELSNLSFNSIAIEPSNLLKILWPEKLEQKEGGFSPDIVIKTRKADGSDHFIIIENKGSGATLRENQLENYPRLMDWLKVKKVSFDFLLLQSVGNNYYLFKKACELQKKYEQFGILLWEEALRVMQKTHFAPQGLPIPLWQVYADALDIDCDKT
jgi:hypothetical protein